MPHRSSHGSTMGQPAASVPLASLPGWPADDHAAAYRAFHGSCAHVLRAVRGGAFKGKTAPSPALLAACDAATAQGPSLSRPKARAFFETNFTAHAVGTGSGQGMLTGYYEPVVAGSSTPTATFKVPIYKRPPDLLNLVDEADRGAVAGALTHARRTATGSVPFATRAAIDKGALRGKSLELAWLADEVEVFMMQVQGSGRISLPDGSVMRVTYDGKNGHAYTSIGKYLIDSGMFAADRMSLAALAAWLRADPERGRRVMWRNASYVFFRRLAAADAGGAHGVWSIPLQPGRSLAIDPSHHVIGAPIYVSAPSLTHATGQRDSAPAGFHRLMVAHDVGSAIKGRERGDIFFGSGPSAGRRAGTTKHPGSFYALHPTVSGTVTQVPTAAPRRTRIARP